MSAEGSGSPDAARSLLDAVTAIASDLDLRGVLTRIIEVATDLTDAGFGALGVIGPKGDLVEFITTGIDDDVRRRIGDLPRGRGILGLIIDRPEPLRLTDLTAHPLSAGFPANHPPMRTFLGVPVRIRGTVFGNLYLTEKSGGREFTTEDEEQVEALARAAGFVIDNARAYGLSERRRRWLEASAELTEALQPPVELARALDLITTTVRTVAGATAAGVVRPGAPHERTVACAPEDAVRVDAVLDDVAARPDLAARKDPLTLTSEGWRVVVIPLRAHLAPDGALVAAFDQGSVPLGAEEHQLLVSFADQVALALDRAQAVVDREELAVISDRERIARDLHDVVIQRLFATGLQLQGIGLIVGPGEVATRVEAAVDDLDDTIKAIRGTIFELQNRQADSLRAEVRALVREYVPVLGFAPTVRTTGPIDTAVSPAVREQLLPVLREAISNVARHALAESAEVEVVVSERELVLTVADDGVGLPATRSESGLRNARRRAAQLGGGLDVTGGRSGHSRGTTLTWRVPLG